MYRNRSFLLSHLLPAQLACRCSFSIAVVLDPGMVIVSFAIFPPREEGLAVIHSLRKCLARGVKSPRKNSKRRNGQKKDELKRKPGRGPSL